MSREKYGSTPVKYLRVSHCFANSQIRKKSEKTLDRAQLRLHFAFHIPMQSKYRQHAERIAC
ncbi:hypothetical protein CSB45_11655 [candidate division KSB3 bacterium]|uniref:Uncharacterized protein n=1 Tax=candidate division KSB3 bacterium TaxID=2044937 RepID=A0A2G6E2N0_9BACT|nr:MAG: hypothetical protein CSB45_11655 [candidate division KSB3 bacterium]PIE29286.1 MAG: hypothetical protein CSA57_09800 [candidate division KSB3 bacterium]